MLSVLKSKITSCGRHVILFQNGALYIYIYSYSYYSNDFLEIPKFYVNISLNITRVFYTDTHNFFKTVPPRLPKHFWCISKTSETNY